MARVRLICLIENACEGRDGVQRAKDLEVSVPGMRRRKEKVDGGSRLWCGVEFYRQISVLFELLT